jgi:hypothetical protein
MEIRRILHTHWTHTWALIDVNAQQFHMRWFHKKYINSEKHRTLHYFSHCGKVIKEACLYFQDFSYPLTHDFDIQEDKEDHMHFLQMWLYLA